MGIVLILFLLLVVGLLLIARRMLVKQQRIVREPDGPADLKRADDLERSGPYDPRAGAQAAEDFYAAGRLPQWMRGVRDRKFDD